MTYEDEQIENKLKQLLKDLRAVNKGNSNSWKQYFK